VTCMALEDVARFGDAGREVDVVWRVEALRELERVIKGLERSPADGLERWRPWVGRVGDASETEFNPEIIDGVSGVFASERPRRCVGVFGFIEMRGKRVQNTAEKCEKSKSS
jgi:hypothetical protein